jgi:hypothetical protein
MLTNTYISYAYHLLSERDKFLVALSLCSCAYENELNYLPAKLLRRFPGRDNIKNVELFIYFYGLLKL